MFRNRVLPAALVALVLLSAAAAAGCGASAESSEYFGKVEPPEGQVFRYISGSEPESLDPQMSTGQPEARIDMALYEGLVEYHPKTMQPIPAIAERWVINHDATEFVFFLRTNARFSNGDPINAHDFVYTVRRGVSPALASRSAFLGYEIKYAQAFNEGGVFVRDPATGRFLSASEAGAEEGEEEGKEKAREVGKETAQETAWETKTTPDAEAPHRDELGKSGEDAAPDTPFHKLMHAAPRLVVPGAEKAREKAFKERPALRELVAGKEFVPITGEDIGVEAVGDYTLRITLARPAPYFVGLVPHQFFRAINRHVIEKHGAAWVRPENIVTSGAFKLKAHRPYHEIVAVRDPMNWDAANVRLDEIRFYPLEALTTMLNLYKAGDVDATYNHSVPAAWLKSGLRYKKDYMNAPENGNEYYIVNTTKPPMNDPRVRRAFSMGVDRRAFAEYRVVAKPLSAFTPEGIFKDYPQPKGTDFDPERAKQLLAEAGYADASGKFDPKKFPIKEVQITYNTGESNQNSAEFIQAQWKQNLGLTVELNSVEWKNFLTLRSELEFKGFARQGWGGDYMDPFTFLSLFTSLSHDNGTGWLDPKYVKMLRDANSEPDQAKRYELLARAEALLLEAQPIIPLVTPATNWMKKPYVKGLYPNPGTLHAWKYVYIEHDPAKWDREMPDMTTDKIGD